LVVVPKRDTVVPPRAGRELGRLLPNGTTVELPCGHLGYLAMPDAIRLAFQRWRSGLLTGKEEETAIA
jgi:hypothetical protein